MTPQPLQSEGLAAQKPLTSLPPAKSVTIADNGSTFISAKHDPSAGPNGNGVDSPAKVAIPRQRSGVAPRYNRRVPRACESCRQRKTKCSGDTPVCRQCRELRVTCQYPVGWKERTKRYAFLNSA